MRSFIVAALLAAAAVAPAGDAFAGADPPQIAPPGCDYGSPSAGAPPQLSQFDFLIGDFAITVFRWTDGAWREVPISAYGPARWNGCWALGGQAIADEWFDKDPGIDPASARGMNVRMWDAEASEWDMMWIHTGDRQVTDLRAKEINGALTMWQVYPERAGFRAYFERYGPGSWARIELEPDGNDGWEPTIKLKADRIPCPDD